MFRRANRKKMPDSFILNTRHVSKVWYNMSVNNMRKCLFTTKYLTKIKNSLKVINNLLIRVYVSVSEGAILMINVGVIYPLHNISEEVITKRQRLEKLSLGEKPRRRHMFRLHHKIRYFFLMQSSFVRIFVFHFAPTIHIKEAFN